MEKDKNMYDLPSDNVKIARREYKDFLVDGYYAKKYDKGKVQYTLVPDIFFNIRLDTIGYDNVPTYDDHEITLLNMNKEGLISFIRYAGLCLGGVVNLYTELAKIYTYGLEKGYGRESWKTVPNAIDRYNNAMERHFRTFKSGKYINEEDGGMLHIAQAAWNALTLLWFMENNNEG